MSNELYKFKQDCFDAVVASDMTPATKVFFIGIFKHMYGVKTVCHPGTDALQEATGLHPSKYPGYRQELFDRGYLSGVKDGRYYRYELATQWVGNDNPVGSDTYPMGREHVPNGYTNTSKKTTRKTTMETNKDESPVADAPSTSYEDSSIKEDRDEYVYMGTLRDEDFKPFPNLKGNLAFDYLANSEGVKSSLSAEVEPPLKGDKDRVEGLKHLELLLRSRNISEEGREAARGRYDDPEYRPYTPGVQRAGWIAGEVQKEEAAL